MDARFLKDKHSSQGKRRFLILLLLSLILVSRAALSQEGLPEILRRPAAFDNRQVVVQGEVIGEALRGKDGWWLNITCDGANLGIFVQGQEPPQEIHNFGSYRRKGDTLRICGVFHAHCLQHREQDIHAQSIEVLKRGFTRQHRLPPSRVILTVVLSIIYLTLITVYLIKLKRSPPPEQD